jgi:guanylate kinase
MKRGYKRPPNFTTRKPRTEEAYEIDEEGDYSSNELNEYVFINKEAFLKKIGNDDFLETVNYGESLY